MNRRVIFGLALVAVGLLVFFLVTSLNRSPSSSAPSQPEYVIALDAGHGGKDPGSSVDGVTEKDINLAIVKRLQTLVDEQEDMGAFLTRTVDVFVPLEERISRAEAAGATIFISVHANSFTDPGVHGVEAWVDDTRADGDPSWVLAAMVVGAVSQSTGASDRGVHSQELYLHHTKMPAISIEVGYMTNPEERELLLDPDYHQKIAEGILAGLRQFIDWTESTSE